MTIKNEVIEKHFPEIEVINRVYRLQSFNRIVLPARVVEVLGLKIADNIAVTGRVEDGASEAILTFRKIP